MRALALSLLIAAAPEPATAPRGAGTLDAAAARAPGQTIPPPPSPEAIEKAGIGDRAFLAGDYRAALFAYQDAVYRSPQYTAARVKLGRAYLALRYAPQAIAQAEQVLSVDPSSAEAKRLLEEARALTRRVTKAHLPAQADPAPPAAPVAAAPQVFDVEPEPAEPLQPAAAPAPPAKARPAAPPSESLLWYRHALDRIANGDPEKAITFLGQSIEADPRHVDAYMKRAELRFGLGEYRVALEDYRAVLAIDPELGAPVYWLAECHRRLGDRWGALDLYKQYVESTAKDVREDLRVDAQERARELR